MAKLVEDPPEISEKDQMQHEALYEEIHKVDDLLETHANIMIVLISGLLAFTFTLKSTVAVNSVSLVGFLVSLEFYLHTYRLRHIAMSASDRLKVIEERIGINTTRPGTYLWRLRVPSGSTLLCGISLLFVALWLTLLVLFNTGTISV